MTEEYELMIAYTNARKALLSAQKISSDFIAKQEAAVHKIKSLKTEVLDMTRHAAAWVKKIRDILSEENRVSDKVLQAELSDYNSCLIIDYSRLEQLLEQDLKILSTRLTKAYETEKHVA